MGVGRGTSKQKLSLDENLFVLADHPTRIIEAIGINTTAARAYIQVFDAKATSDVTLGTTTPDYVIPMLANAHEIVRPDRVFRNGVVVASTTDVNNAVGATAHLFAVLG